ncbi:uncharacterized protein LOC144209435 [Stigmatopora nigra]
MPNFPVKHGYDVKLPQRQPLSKMQLQSGQNFYCYCHCFAEKHAFLHVAKVHHRRRFPRHAAKNTRMIRRCTFKTKGSTFTRPRRRRSGPKQSNSQWRRFLGLKGLELRRGERLAAIVRNGVDEYRHQWRPDVVEMRLKSSRRTAKAKPQPGPPPPPTSSHIKERTASFPARECPVGRPYWWGQQSNVVVFNLERAGVMTRFMEGAGAYHSQLWVPGVWEKSFATRNHGNRQPHK